MKKIRMTRNDLRGSDCIAVGYCELGYLLRYKNAVGYNCGVYGWNYDIYDFDDKVITTGYRGMVGREPRVDAKEYERKARAICEDVKDYNEQREKINALLAEFVERA